MELTYESYLMLDQLLRMQVPRSDPAEHDEMLFIVIHQTYELWFRLMLHEAEKVRADFYADDLYGAIATLKRMRAVLKTLVGQLDILETMTPLSFASFRDRLDTASGFQSVQFREMEFLFGYKRPDVIRQQPTEAGRARLEARLAEPSLMDALYRMLRARGVRVPQALVDRDVRGPIEASEEFQEALEQAYRDQPDLVILFELLMDCDEGIQEWRYRHVKLVERTIGRKHGTGGSAGIEFLKQSLFRPLFPDLWAVRQRM